MNIPIFLFFFVNLPSFSSRYLKYMGKEFKPENDHIKALMEKLAQIKKGIVTRNLN